MRLPRMTTRRLMIMVAVVAVSLQMAITAFHVGYDPACRWILHIWERKDGPEVVSRPTTTTPCVAPFWPQYWRRLLGRHWPGTFRCECLNEGDTIMLGIGAGTECRPHKYVGSRAVSRERAWQIEATLQSLKVIGIMRPDPPAVDDQGDERIAGESAEKQ